MTEIVLGVASSHSPQLSSGPEWWSGHAGRDRANSFLVDAEGQVRSFDELLASAPEGLASELGPEVWERKFQRAQDAVQALGKLLHDAAPDVVLVVGDDQRELFLDDVSPAVGMFLGDTLVDEGLVEERVARIPPDILPAQWAAHAEVEDPYPVHRELSLHLASHLTLAGFDVGVFSQQTAHRTLGHAFTFARRRLGVPASVPMVPVFLNTYYPPNVPTPGRCWALGGALRVGLELWDGPLRVALVATGGLSHFVVSEELDGRVLRALADADGEAVAALPRLALRSGTSEILNWIVVGGALADWELQVVDYVPAYRSLAGTGVGMGFAAWSPSERKPRRGSTNPAESAGDVHRTAHDEGGLRR